MILECNVSLSLSLSRHTCPPVWGKGVQEQNITRIFCPEKRVTSFRLLTLTWLYSSPANVIVFEGEMDVAYKIYEGKKMHI